MNRTIALCLLLLTAFVAGAQSNVTIRGTLENGAQKRVELYGYEDMLTKKEVLLSSCEADTLGAFAVSCYANYPRLVYVQVECYSQSFYVEPGRTYEVYLPAFDWDLNEKRNIYLAPEALPLEFLNLPLNELNVSIMRFEDVADSFMTAHWEHFDPKYKPSVRLFNQMVEELSAKVPATEGGAFFERYREYTLAEMRLAMRFASRKKMIAKYILDRPIHYHDENYMRLFLSLFEYSVSRGTKKIAQERLVAWVDHGQLETYLDSLGLDPQLRNEQVRELVALQALKESYYDRAYDREAVRAMVEKLGVATKFAEHRQLAQNLSESMARQERGAQAPSMELPDVEHRMVNLESFRGQWVYLSFVRAGDPHSLKELETMAHFRDTVYAQHPDVKFVTVVCDREFQKMYHLLKNSKRGQRYNWTWLHFDGNYRLLEHYGVTSYPTFVLINPQGELHYSVTPAPASGILLRGPWQKSQPPKDEGGPAFKR